MEERFKLPQWGLGQSPNQQTIWCILESKVQLWWQQLLLIFLRTNVISAQKQACYHTAGPIPYNAAPYEFFSCRHHCPVEFGACGKY